MHEFLVISMAASTASGKKGKVINKMIVFHATVGNQRIN